MPVRRICQNFFRDALAPFHKYRQNALLDSTIALINGASLTLTCIGRFLPGHAQVKHKIKRVDRLAANRNIWDRVRLHEPNMPGATVIFIFIKKRQRGEKINVPVADRQGSHR